MPASDLRPSIGKLVLVLALLSLAATVPCLGADASGATKPGSPGPASASYEGDPQSRAPALEWVPPEDGFDWIQLRSGEWLKGTLKAMQERSLEFDSEELGLLTIDWKKVRQVRSRRTLDVLFANGVKISGPVAVTPTEVKVGVDENAQVLSRDQMQSLTPGGSKERNYWSGKGTVGLTVQAGNTKQTDFNAKLHLQRRTPSTRLSLDYVGNLSKSGDAENANNHRVNSEFDLWLSKRLYLILPSLEYYRDPFQNTKAKVTTGLGLGYDIVDHKNLEWNISTGPAFQKTWFESTQPGVAPTASAFAATFGSRFDWNITNRVELLLEYRGQFTSKEVGETTHHGASTLSVELTKRFDLDVSLIWDRISKPKTGDNGITPKPDDYRLVVGVGVDF